MSPELGEYSALLLDDAPCGGRVPQIHLFHIKMIVHVSVAVVAVVVGAVGGGVHHGGRLLLIFGRQMEVASQQGVRLL